MKAARVKKGSVVWNKRFRTWNFLWIQDGRRRSKVIGTLQDYRTKQAATQAAEALRCFVDQPTDGAVPTVRYLVEEFRREKMPERFSTRLGYEAWLKNHILPRWGGCGGDGHASSAGGAMAQHLAGLTQESGSR